MSKINTSWDNIADWYQDSVVKEGSYHRELIYPNLLRMSTPKKGERVLDIACGEGSWGTILFSKECVVHGVDISPELIRMAQKKLPQGRFIVVNAENLSAITEKNFDKVFMILALQNIKEANRAIDEVSRLLRVGGTFYIVLNHPCFRVPKFSDWEWSDNVQYRRIARYLSENKSDILMRPGLSSQIKTISFHRPLQYFFKAFDKAGMAVTRLEEWNSTKQSQPGPRAIIEDRARKEIPLFMAIECKKL